MIQHAIPLLFIENIERESKGEEERQRVCVAIRCGLDRQRGCWVCHLLMVAPTEELGVICKMRV